MTKEEALQILKIHDKIDCVGCNAYNWCSLEGCITQTIKVATKRGLVVD